MAQPISYTPPPPTADPATEQLADLARALDESGLLRALTGAVRAYPELAEQLVTRLDPERIRGLLALAQLGTVVQPDGAEKLVGGVRAAVAAGDHALTARQPPSLVGLARQLGDPDVRRGASAVLAALGAFGAAMKDD